MQRLWLRISLAIYTQHVGRRYQRVKGAHFAALWGNHLLTSAVLADSVQASGGNATLFRSLTKTPQPLIAPSRQHRACPGQGVHENGV